MTGLRERRHRETRRQLVDAAFSLFDRHGFDNVTVAEVAAAAGVSRSTAYRRFPTKEDLVLEIPRRWIAVFDEARAALAPESPLVDAVREVTMAVARHIDRDPEVVRGAYRVLEQAPSLESGTVATAAWVSRYSELVREFGAIDTDAAAMIAGAYMGAIDAMMRIWAAAADETTVEQLADTMLARLEPILSGR